MFETLYTRWVGTFFGIFFGKLSLNPKQFLNVLEPPSCSLSVLHFSSIFLFLNFYFAIATKRLVLLLNVLSIMSCSTLPFNLLTLSRIRKFLIVVFITSKEVSTKTRYNCGKSFYCLCVRCDRE